MYDLWFWFIWCRNRFDGLCLHVPSKVLFQWLWTNSPWIMWCYIRDIENKRKRNITNQNKWWWWWWTNSQNQHTQLHQHSWLAKGIDTTSEFGSRVRPCCVHNNKRKICYHMGTSSWILQDYSHSISSNNPKLRMDLVISSLSGGRSCVQTGSNEITLLHEIMDSKEELEDDSKVNFRIVLKMKMTV